jgi:hypothetical protein
LSTTVSTPTTSSDDWRSSSHSGERLTPRRSLKKSREERITEAIVGIRVIDAELTVLAAQPDADEWLIAELICQRTKRQHELDNLRRSS